MRGHLKKIRSRWRKLPPGRITLIVLAVLRHDRRLSDMAGGSGISASTVHRRLLEVIGLLAAGPAPGPRPDRRAREPGVDLGGEAGALADLGFVGLDDDPDDPVIVTGRKATRGHRLTEAQKEANRLVSRERAANEHGFDDLKN